MKMAKASEADLKMAKASEADLKMAMDLTLALESFERYRSFPEAMRPGQDDATRFDEDNGEHCREAMEHLLALVRSASLMRVVWGMAVVVDPRNEVVDPDADTLEVHPKFKALEADAERYRWLRANTTDQIPYRGWWEIAGGAGAVPEKLDAAIDAALARETQNVADKRLP